MKLLIVGAGSVGGYFGARLAAAGRDVTFLVRPSRAEQLERGLTIRTNGADTVVPVKVMVGGQPGGPLRADIGQVARTETGGGGSSAEGARSRRSPIVAGRREDYVGCMKTFLGTAVAVSAALLIGSAATVAAPTDESSSQATASAKWVPRKLNFIYQGFTSKYTCDGLRDQMKQILQQLGAGNDLVVKRYGCTRLDGPEPSPGVQATFSVLSSAGTSDHGAAGSKEVAARWDTITLNSDTPHQSNWGDCELIEQVKRQVLPLFTTRNLTYTSSCFPHDVSLAGVHLSVEVLRPVTAAAAQPAQP